VAILERRYEARVEEMLRDVEVPPEMGKGLLTRWETFAEPFAAALDAPAQRRHALEDGTGLLSHLGHKTGVAIASLQDQERPGLLKFLGPGPWDHQPSLATPADQVGEPWGEPDAVLVFDPSGFPQKATKSGGVARPGCGRLGQVDNCPVGASRADVSPTGPALVDRRLSLPEGGAKDRGRREEAGVPKAVSFPTRHELAWEMLTGWGGRRPHPGVAGDDERGRPWGFRQGWPTRNERDLLAAPSNLLIRDLEVAPPEDSGRGRPPQVPIARWDRWCGALAESAWTRIDGRDGANGAVVIDAVQRRTEARTEPGARVRRSCGS
jgi:hypothetical protein